MTYFVIITGSLWILVVLVTASFGGVGLMVTTEPLPLVILGFFRDLIALFLGIMLLFMVGRAQSQMMSSQKGGLSGRKGSEFQGNSSNVLVKSASSINHAAD